MLGPQFLSQFAYVVSCKWRSKSSGFIWVYNSVTYDLPRKQVVTKVVFLTLFLRNYPSIFLIFGPDNQSQYRTYCTHWTHLCDVSCPKIPHGMQATCL